MKHLFIFFVLFVASLNSSAQISRVEEQDEEVANVERYDWPNLSKHIGTTIIIPFFSQTKDMFWYAYNQPGKETEYRMYDVKKRKKRVITKEQREILFKNIPPHFNRYGTSPDSLYCLSIGKDKNLYVENLRTHEKKQMSTDGEKDNDYEVADVKWTKDGHFFIPRRDHRNVRNFSITYYGFMPPNNANYEYELPGDTIVAHNHFYVGNASTGELRYVNTDKWPVQQITQINLKDVDDRQYFWREKRTRDAIELCYLDTLGNITSVLYEESKPYINPDLNQCHIINSGNDIFLWSDRTGWGHIYHYDGKGNLISAVTSGEWTAGKISKIDTKNRRLYFYGYGREKGHNPIYPHFYSVRFDGTDLRLLTPENASHNVFMDPNMTYLVDNFSRIDTVPQTCVRRADGKMISIIEKTDLTDLMAYGWRFPEQVVSKAADGVTDVYGIMWKPFDFDPNKKYPVISQVYPGPFTDTVWGPFTVNDKYANEALAQRGFIVIVIGHRGANPYRSKEYRIYGYGNLRDNCIEDDIYSLKHLAKSRPYMDMDRIGIYGHSGGALMAFSALCQHPEFYKCAVASSGNHDNNIYNRFWGETYQGLDSLGRFKVKTNMELASKLSRPLLLATGDADQNVHPAHTLRLTDALIKANKDYELLILPGCSHHYNERTPLYQQYFERRKRDFFCKYLMNNVK